MIKTLLSNRFVHAALWMYVAVGVTSIGNYIYHLLMARMLNPSSLLGELEGVISFMYILSVPLLTVSLAVVKFVSVYKGKNRTQEISGFYFFLRSKVLLFGGVASVILLLFSPFLKSFLHLSSYSLVLLLVINFVVGTYVVVGRSILQGLSDFFGFAISTSVETIVKLVLAVLLVSVGFKVVGAFGAIIIGSVIGAFVLYGLLKSFQAKSTEFIDASAFYRYIVPVFFTMLAVTSLYSTDVILVRHFFPGNQSGDYAVLSIMGKVIFFAVSPISIVLFPLISERHTKGEKYDRFLWTGFGLTFVGAAIITAIYFWQGELMILLLPGENYLHVASLLGLMGIFIGFYSLCVLMANFYLSIHKTRQNFFIVSAAIAQILGIYFFHRDLSQVIQVSIIVSFVLLISLLLYYPYVWDRK